MYGTHYGIPCTREQMDATRVLLAETPGDTAQTELREHNPFASRSMVTSSATLPTQGQAGCKPVVEPPRATASLLKDPRRANNLVEEEVSSTTDAMEAAAKEQPMATPSAQVGMTNANLWVPRESI